MIKVLKTKVTCKQVEFPDQRALRLHMWKKCWQPGHQTDTATHDCHLTPTPIIGKRISKAYRLVQLRCWRGEMNAQLRCAQEILAGSYDQEGDLADAVALLKEAVSKADSAKSNYGDDYGLY